VKIIEATCDSGHTQALRVPDEGAEQFAAILDGKSPLYISPVGPLSAIGKCGVCGKPFKATVRDDAKTAEPQSAVEQIASRVWVEDRSWRLLPEGHAKKCRMVFGPGKGGCKNQAVAEWNRVFASGKRRSFAYCQEHLYGRVISAETILVEVAADSPAAKAGFAE
jgi:hypothetical protein